MWRLTEMAGAALAVLSIPMFIDWLTETRRKKEES